VVRAQLFMGGSMIMRYSVLKQAAAALLIAACALPGAFAQPAHRSAAKPRDPFAHVGFRNLGPAVAGGRVTAVAGIPGNPRIYYVGSAGGGVFKTTDG